MRRIERVMALICRKMVMCGGISIKYGFTSRTPSGNGVGSGSHEAFGPASPVPREDRAAVLRRRVYLRTAGAVGLALMMTGVSVVVVLVGGASGVAMAGMVGIVGTVVPDPVTFTNGDTLGVGIVAQELTPRLGISQESRGIPTLGLPPGVVGVVDTGLDGEATLDPALHIPVTPTVPVADVADIPAIDAAVVGAAISTICVLPDVCALPDVAVMLVVAAAPADAAVEVVADPIAIPPPS